MQYADFATWQREYLGGRAAGSSTTRRHRLDGAPELLALPSDRPRPVEQNFLGNEETITIGADLAQAVRSFAARHRVTEFMAMVTAFVALLHRYTDQDDIVVGTPVANRRRSESEDLLGFVANTVVLRADVTGTPSFATLLDRVRRTCLDAYDHQDLPFVLLVDELQPRRSLAAAPLFQAGFNIVDHPFTTHEAAGLTFDLVEWHNNTAKFDLNMIVVPGPGGEAAVRLEHRTDMFEPASAQRILRSYELMLAAMVADLDRSVVDVPVLPFGQRWPDQVEPSVRVGPRPTGSRELRRVLTRIWSDVLDVAPIDPDDDFFVIGGNSLLAADVVARVGAILDRSISLRTLFEYPTVAELASVLDGAEPAGDNRSDEPFSDTPADRPALTPASGPRELSFAQHRLWFLEQLSPGTTAYNIFGCRHLLGMLDVELLERCVRTVVARHESLRTTFPSVDGHPTVALGDHRDWRLRVDDLSAHGEQAAALAQELVRDEANTPFDLDRGPLLRCRLVKLDEAEHLLLVSLHHIVADAWSLSLFLAELGELYRADGNLAGTDLPALPVQYHDYATWQRTLLTEDHLDRLLEYWTDQLEDAPRTLDLPTRRPRPAVPAVAGGMTSLVLPADVSAAVRTLGAEAGTTTFMTLLAATATVLSRWTWQEDMVIGVPVAVRDAPETRNLIGLFMNTLAMRVDLSGRPTFLELLGRVRTTCLDAYLHQALPFERLVENLPIGRDPSRSPLFQVLVNMVNVAEAPQELRGVTVNEVELPPPATKVDLTLYARETAGQLRFELTYRADLYDADLMRALLDQIATLLDGAAQDPNLPIHRYPLDDAGRRLPDIDRPQDPAAPAPRVHEELTRRHQPESVVVVDQSGPWTLERLEQAAGRFAIEPGAVVELVGRQHGELLAEMLAALRRSVLFTVGDTLIGAEQIVRSGRAQAETLGLTPDDRVAVAVRAGPRIVRHDLVRHAVRRWPAVPAG